MVAKSLKNLVSLTREAVRDARQTLEELVNAVNPKSYPQPQLVPVPVKNRVPGSPFVNGGGNRRQFSTFMYLRASSTVSGKSSSISSVFSKFIRQQQFKNAQYIRNNINPKFWSYSTFGRPLNSRLPTGVYRNFVGLSARSFSSYGGTASKQTVTNLTTGLRCLLNNGTDESFNLYTIKMEKSTSGSRLTYHGCLSTIEAPNTIQLARNESTGLQSTGSFVEFKMPNLDVNIPTMAFINEEIMESIDLSLEKIKLQIAKTQDNIEKIFQAYGSLPIEKMTDGSIRIHFPNLDPEEAEKLLIELGITDGYVYSNEEINLSRSNSTVYTDASSIADFINDNEAPPLVSSEEESELSDICSEASYNTNDFFNPILSSSGNSNSEPVIVLQESYNFSDISPIH
ncbi:hypothetical protein WICMUC_002025 [Wickerhamomyces mucosus]|uniref:Stationary phase protein 5 n=1 Tax=Wickerhamomyces mucosus TaxID=1378264 RepID=A0A9P8PSA9_9ASCO|nr:hypothetical protein WICMUC_002025 [Wickerhamomyces mucosus]